MADDFEAWATTSAPRLKRVAYLLTGDTADADDLLQDTFVRLLTRAPAFAAVSNADAYARTVMTNLYLTQHKRRTRFRVLRHLLAAPDHVAASEAVDAASSFHDMLRSLGPRQRAVLVLRHHARLDDAEIAAVLGCSASTVRSQAARAIDKLRQQHLNLSETGGSRHGQS